MIDGGLERENLMVLTLSQSLLGMVFDNLQAASVEVLGRTVVLHFWLQHDPTDADSEDLDDIVGDFEAFIGQEAVIGGSSEVQVPQLHVGVLERLTSMPGRPVFRRKPPAT
jgi:hypothetical protein